VEQQHCPDSVSVCDVIYTCPASLIDGLLTFGRPHRVGVRAQAVEELGEGTKVLEPAHGYRVFSIHVRVIPNASKRPIQPNPTTFR